MPSQLPPPGSVFLDHAAHFVPAMDMAAAALERCGFRLTPFTAQANRVDGAVVPTGTGNRCVMLRRGYVEVLTAIPTVAGDTDLAYHAGCAGERNQQRHSESRAMNCSQHVRIGERVAKKCLK